MAYFEFPHTRSYEGDLGYIIKKLMELTDRYNDFFQYNQITFADPINWDITKQYPPYQIVFDFDSNCSYISKKPVPAGVTISNGDYWELVGPLIVDGDARTEIDRILHFVANIYESGTTATAVRSVGEFVIVGGVLYKTTSAINVGETYSDGYNVTTYTIENMIHDLIATDRPIDAALDISSTNAVENGVITGALNTLSGNVTTISGAVTANTADIANLYGLRDFSTRKYIVISDSYGMTPDVSNSWIGKFKTYMNIPNDNFFRDQYGGAGFVGVNTNTFEYMLNNIVSGMTADEKAEITDIIVGGGFNDANAIRSGLCTVDDVRNAITSFCTYVRTNLPNAQFYLFMPAWSSDYTYHSMLLQIINIYQQTVMASPESSYIDGIYWLHRQALLDSTQFHPGLVGADCIAKSLTSILRGGSAFCDLAVGPGLSPTYTVNSADITAFTPTGMKQFYSEGIATMLWRKLEVTPTNNLVDGGSVKICDFTDGIMSGGDLFEGYIGTVTATGAKVCLLAIWQNALWLVNASGTTFTGGSVINIQANSISGPIML